MKTIRKQWELVAEKATRALRGRRQGGRVLYLSVYPLTRVVTLDHR